MDSKVSRLAINTDAPVSISIDNGFTVDSDSRKQWCRLPGTDMKEIVCLRGVWISCRYFRFGDVVSLHRSAAAVVPFSGTFELSALSFCSGYTRIV